MIDPALSDLFFSNEDTLSTYGNVLKHYEDQKKIDPDKMDSDKKIAMKNAAYDFLHLYSGILSCNIPTEEDLAKDFLRRI